MCIKTLTLENLETIKNFKYVGKDNSIFYACFLSPCLNFLINFVPTNLAPNVITLASFACNILSFYVTYLEVGNDYEMELSRNTCLMQAIIHFSYLALDNLDGKQARKTGTSSAYGMLLDHGCDVFTNIIVCFNMSHLLMLGDSDFFSPLYFMALLPGFYALTYQEYVFGELTLGYCNGADEGNVLVSLFSFMGFLFGSEIYSRNFLGFTLGHFIALLTFILSILTIIVSSLLTILRKAGYKAFIKALYDWAPLYQIIICPFMTLIFSKYYYSEYFTIIMVTLSAMFAVQTLNLQISILIKEKVNFSLMVLIANGAIVFTYFCSNEKLFILIYAFVCIGLFTEIALIVVVRSIEILNYLNLKLLCINKNNEEVVLNAV